MFVDEEKQREREGRRKMVRIIFLVDGVKVPKIFVSCGWMIKRTLKYEREKKREGKSP